MTEIGDARHGKEKNEHSATLGCGRVRGKKRKLRRDASSLPSRPF